MGAHRRRTHQHRVRRQRAAALTDGFFYSPAAQTGIELADPGLRAGSTYRETAIADDVATDPATLTPPAAAARVTPAFVPQSLRDWITAQGAPSGGAGLAELIGRLRERGYLSHAVSIDPAKPPAWATALPGYTFQPSRAGHSTDRIGDLFTALLQRQNEVGANGGASLVAAVGDDEQFAVAAALIADQLGFPARVVLGARLGGDGAEPACQDGACRGADMSAWIEVQDASGAWTPLDVTPQHTRPIAPELQNRRDPQNATDVTPQQAQAVLPPESTPADRGSDDRPPPSSADLGTLWRTLRIGGMSVLILIALLGPFAAVLLAKAVRRRARRRTIDPTERITGGWDEYVDAAVDAGGALPRTETRRELAALYGGGDAGARLASAADRSVFAPDDPTEDEAHAFWHLVENERVRIAREGGWWRRLRTRLSLRSFRRAFRPSRRRGESS